MGKTSETDSIIVRGGTAYACMVEGGAVVQITDVKGKQVGDLVLFDAHDLTHRFSQGNTRKLENRIYLRQGSTLWSTQCRPLVQIEADTVNRHDILSSACSPYDYPIRFGIKDHRSCLANLTEALAPFGIAEFLIPDPMNVFMHQHLTDDGVFTVKDPLSQAGDYIRLRLLRDCLFAISACPQDQNRCNGGTITDLRLDISDEGRPESD
jgi:uncharacterized protein YcgI (DUF1989 family)